MSLTQAEIAELKRALADVPLVAQSSRFIEDFAAVTVRFEVNAGQVIFEPDAPVGQLYLLAEGAITQTMGTSGQPWYQKELKPGDFMGQRSLISGRHESRAVSTAPSVVYSMPASALALLQDRYPAFHEVLWKETLASRLRSLPLFESLSDGEVSWLVELVEEKPLAEGVEVPINQEQGLWLVDWGQVVVVGPAAILPSLQNQPPGPAVGQAASPGAGPEPEWTITAGNFVFTLQPGTRFGGRCAALRAQTVRESKLLFLPDRHFNRMLAALPAVRPMTDAPLDIPACLAGSPLFGGRGTTPAHIQHLAKFCAWAFVPANQNISTQGTAGYSFVYVIKGGSLVTAVDDRGRQRPVHLLQSRDSYGRTALLESTRRDATVRAVPGPAGSPQGTLGGAEILKLDRRDLEVAFAERPDLWHPGVELFENYERVRVEKPRFNWLEEGEQVVWTSREHWYTITGDLVSEALIILVALAGLDLLLSGPLDMSLRAVVIADLVILAFFVLPIAGYLVWNYRQTYFVVTNRRVTRREIQFVISEARIDAPLESVQDVTYNSTFMGRVLGFGDVTVRTAAKVGSVVFEHVPQPEQVNQYVTQAKAAALVAVRGSGKEALRRTLLSDLRLALTVPDLDALRALGEDAEPQVTYSTWQRFTRALSGRRQRTRTLPPRRRAIPSWLRSFLSILIPSGLRDVVLGPPPRERKLAGGEIVWRKHPINLLQRGGQAFLSAVLLIAAGVMIPALAAILPVGWVALVLVWLVLAGGVAFWVWYVITDWRNDLYIVTDERIIDVEKKPLALSSTQRESSLEVIQTVKSDQPSIWAKLLNYGDVQIRTAAADEGFTFKTVAAPMLVQRTIFQKLDTYRRRQEQKRLEDRRRDVMEGVEVYHDLKENQGRTRWP